VGDERPLYEVFLDYAVFAPIGLVLEAVEELPKLSEKGRERVEKQVMLARMLGRLAFGQAQRKFEKVTGLSPGESGSPAESGWAAESGSPAESNGAAARASSAAAPRASTGAAPRTSRAAAPRTSRGGTVSRSAEPAAAGGPEVGDEDEAPSATRSAGTEAIVAAVLDEPGAENETTSFEDEPASGLGGSEQPSADDLAIPGYDTLAASQVVQRLASLETDELEAIRRYEVATRGRRTILHRIAQLAAGSGRASA
jgi:hypothetical protein